MKFENRISEESVRHLIQKARSETGLVRGSLALALLRKAWQEWSKPENTWKKRIQDLTKDNALTEAVGEFLKPDTWNEKIRNELRLPRSLDQMWDGGGRLASVAFRPLGVLLHITPGNSFWAGFESAIYGLVSGNANIVRLSCNVTPVLNVVVELLRECGMCEAQIQLCTWRSSDTRITDTAKNLVDAIAVWGGHEVIESFRVGLRPGIRLIEFGPKLSLSILTKEGTQVSHHFDMITRDACAFEQMSCSSSQVLLIKNDVDLPWVLETLARSFQKYSEESKPRMKSKHEQIEMLKELERAKRFKSEGKGDFISGYPDWLISVKPQGSQVEPSPLFRTLLIYRYQDDQGLKELLGSVRHYLQTASLACGVGEKMALTELLWDAGVNRVVAAGRSTESMEGAPHDGGFILQQFLRAVSFEDPEHAKHLWAWGDDNHHRQQLKAHLKSVDHVPFYSERVKRDFESTPWLKKEDMHRFGPPLGDKLMEKSFFECEDVFLFTTGGSTGEPKYNLYTRDEWEDVTDIFARQYEALGLTRQDRVVNLFVGGGLWSAFLAVSRGLEKLGCMNLPLGGDIEPKQALEIFRKFQVTGLIGLPSTILKLAHAAELEPEPRLRIPKILYKGEFMSEPMRNYVQKVFGSQLIKSGGYAAVDAGTVGYQCAHAQGGVHHVLERYCLVEICDEETGHQVSPGKVGEIIVTNFSKKLLPIIRLRTGDRGRQVLEPCVCGTRAFTFELLGRSDDMVRAGGANIFVSDVDKLCQNLNQELSYIYQMQVFKKGVDDAYKLVIEAARFMDDDEKKALLPKVRESYLGIAQELKHYIDEGYLRHFDIEILDEGSIKPHPKTRKIRRMVDLR